MTSAQTSLAGWILVGGHSRRMGQDKATLPVGGVPLALNLAMEISQVAGSVTLVGGAQRYEDWGVPAIEDPLPDCGPLAGIVASLKATTVDGNLIVACDMPRLTAAALKPLVAAWHPEMDVLVPEHTVSQLEPLCAIYHRRVLPLAEQALAERRLKVLDLLKMLNLTRFSINDERPFTNVNTPQDWRLLGHLA